MAQKGLQEFYYTPDVGFKTSCHLSTLQSEKLKPGLALRHRLMIHLVAEFVYIKKTAFTTKQKKQSFMMSKEIVLFYLHCCLRVSLRES